MGFCDGRRWYYRVGILASLMLVSSISSGQDDGLDTRELAQLVLGQEFDRLDRKLERLIDQAERNGEIGGQEWSELTCWQVESMLRQDKLEEAETVLLSMLKVPLTSGYIVRSEILRMRLYSALARWDIVQLRLNNLEEYRSLFSEIDQVNFEVDLYTAQMLWHSGDVAKARDKLEALKTNERFAKSRWQAHHWLQAWKLAEYLGDTDFQRECASVTVGVFPIEEGDGFYIAQLALRLGRHALQLKVAGDSGADSLLVMAATKLYENGFQQFFDPFWRVERSYDCVGRGQYQRTWDVSPFVGPNSVDLIYESFVLEAQNQVFQQDWEGVRKTLGVLYEFVDSGRGFRPEKVSLMILDAHIRENEGRDVSSLFASLNELQESMRCDQFASVQVSKALSAMNRGEWHLVSSNLLSARDMYCSCNALEAPGMCLYIDLLYQYFFEDRTKEDFDQLVGRQTMPDAKFQGLMFQIQSYLTPREGLAKLDSLVAGEFVLGFHKSQLSLSNAILLFKSHSDALENQGLKEDAWFAALTSLSDAKYFYEGNPSHGALLDARLDVINKGRALGYLEAVLPEVEAVLELFKSGGVVGGMATDTVSWARSCAEVYVDMAEVDSVESNIFAADSLYQMVLDCYESRGLVNSVEYCASLNDYILFAEDFLWTPRQALDSIAMLIEHQESGIGDWFDQTPSYANGSSFAFSSGEFEQGLEWFDKGWEGELEGYLEKVSQLGAVARLQELAVGSYSQRVAISVQNKMGLEMEAYKNLLMLRDLFHCSEFEVGMDTDDILNYWKGVDLDLKSWVGAEIDEWQLNESRLERRLTGSGSGCFSGEDVFASRISSTAFLELVWMPSVGKESGEPRWGVLYADGESLEVLSEHTYEELALIQATWNSAIESEASWALYAPVILDELLGDFVVEDQVEKLVLFWDGELNGVQLDVLLAEDDRLEHCALEYRVRAVESHDETSFDGDSQFIGVLGNAYQLAEPSSFVGGSGVLPDLEGASQELVEAEDVFIGAGWDCQIWDRSGSIQDLPGLLKGADVIHFSAHGGKLLGRRGLLPEMTGSNINYEREIQFLNGLYLVQGDSLVYLPSSKIECLSFDDAPLVFIASCNSGVSTIVPGLGELGLVTSFFRAGAGSVVASRWEVSDEASSLFSAKFYAALADGETLSASIGSARVAMKSRGFPPREWMNWYLVKG